MAVPHDTVAALALLEDITNAQFRPEQHLSDHTDELLQSLFLQTFSVHHFCHFLPLLPLFCCLCLSLQIILVSIRQQSVNSDFFSD